MSDQQDLTMMASWPVKAITVIFALVVSISGLWIISGFLPALVWAAVIAVAIDPLYLRVANTRLSQRYASLPPTLVTLVVAVVLIVPLVAGISRAAYEISSLTTWIAHAEHNGVPVPAWVEHLPFFGQSLKDWWSGHLATPEGTQSQFKQFNTTNWLEHSRNIGANLVHRAVILAFTLLSLFFLLRDRDSIVRQCRAVGYRLLGDTSDKVLQQTVLAIRSTIDGLVLVGLGEGAVMTVAYLLLGVPHPLLMGAVTGIAAIIPFGAALMFGIAAALLLAQGAMLYAVSVIVIGLLVVAIADHFVRPALIGGAIRLPFLWVLLGILGGVETLGLLGLFIGPTIMAVLHMLWSEYAHNSKLER